MNIYESEDSVDKKKIAVFNKQNSYMRQSTMLIRMSEQVDQSRLTESVLSISGTKDKKNIVLSIQDYNETLDELEITNDSLDQAFIDKQKIVNDIQKEYRIQN